MMLQHLGYPQAHDAMVNAIQASLADSHAPKTPDMGGTANTADVGKAIASLI